MSETSYTLWYRISKAGLVVVYNLVLWVLIPSVIFSELGRALPSSPIPLSNGFIYTFGIVITALQAIGTLTTGMAVSVPFVSGSFIAEAYYIWSAVSGGTLAFSASGLAITLAFQPLLFLLMLPSLFSAVKAPITYLLDQSEAALPSPDVA